MFDDDTSTVKNGQKDTIKILRTLFNLIANISPGGIFPAQILPKKKNHIYKFKIQPFEHLKKEHLHSELKYLVLLKIIPKYSTYLLP